MKLLLLSVLLFNLAACSSAKKSAKALSDEGKYEEAVKHWEKALKDDPKDKEAIVGLKEAQEGAINLRLVEVRNLRNSKEYSRSLRALRDLVQIQKAWKFKLDVNSAQFQGKEAQGLWTPFKSELSLALEQNKPLLAAYSYQDLKHLFSFVPSLELTSEWNKIKAAGVAQCRQFKTAEKFAATVNFQNQFCRYFGEKKSRQVKLKDSLLAPLKINLQMLELPAGLEGITQESLLSALKATPWFHPQGLIRPEAQLKGSFVVSKNTTPVQLVHEYMVEESYLDNEEVVKKRSVPYSVSEKVCATQNPQECTYQNVTKYREEKYKEYRQVKKKRQVKRFFPYAALKDVHEMRFHLDGDLTWNGHKVAVASNHDFSEEVISHETNVPQIGLAPKARTLTKPREQYLLFVDKLKQNVITKLSENWEESFCRDSQSDPNEQAENVFRCRMLKTPNATALSDKWMSTHLGISSSEASVLLGE